MARNKNKKPWTKEEKDYIKNNFMFKTHRELAIDLERTKLAVDSYMNRMGLKRGDASREKLIGKKFGRLTVIRFVKMSSDRSGAIFQVKCDCGIIKMMRRDHFTSGQTLSCGCIRRDNLEKSQYNSYYISYKFSAKTRNLQFLISKDLFQKIILKNCYYCGIPPQKIMNKRIPTVFILGNGIDRYNNDMGYTKENCVPCCSNCNYLKHGRDGDEFLSTIQKIYNYRIKKGLTSV